MQERDSSLTIFRQFMTRLSTGVSLTMLSLRFKELCCKAVLSRDCYEFWLSNRKVLALSPERAFRKVITAHVRGSEGLEAFTPEEEKGILIELRKKEVWPCFKQTRLRIGINGFRAFGYHESVASNSSSELTSNSSKHKLNKNVSSHKVFMTYAPAVNGRSQILSKECFETWVATRKNGCKKPEFSFRKALIAHLTGKDGRRPFPPDIEKLVLNEVRRKEVWPCFVDKKEQKYKNIGMKGCKQYGFHESQHEIKKEQVCSIEREVVDEHDQLVGSPDSTPCEEQLSLYNEDLGERKYRKRRIQVKPEIIYNNYDSCCNKVKKIKEENYDYLSFDYYEGPVFDYESGFNVFPVVESSSDDITFDDLAELEILFDKNQLSKAKNDYFGSFTKTELLYQ